MNKIKTMLKSMSDYFKQVTDRYPFTAALIVLAALFTAVFIDQSGALGKFMEDRGISFTILWGIGTFFAETFWQEKRGAKRLGIAAAGAAAAGLIILGEDPAETVREAAAHWKWAYGIILISLGVYRNHGRSCLPFNEYCIRVVHGLSRTAIICGIISLGVGMVMGTFVTLILSGDHFMLILRAEFLVLGILTGFGILDAQIGTDRDLPAFFTAIVRYPLMILLTAAFAIVYAYILKIIITRVVPSNEIFRILAGLFIIGLPIWTMIGTFSRDHFLVRLGVRLPYIYIPFLFLQGYAIRERIAAYGMTPFRYLCLALMVFEIIYIIVYALRKGETGGMLPLIAAMAFIALVCPRINMYSIADRSQKAIFDRYIDADFASLPADDQSSLAGAYYYLAGNAEGRTMLDTADPEKIEAIKASGKIGNPDYDRDLYIYYDFPIREADISGFERMSMLGTFSFGDDPERPEMYDPERIDLFDSEGNPVLRADLSGFINACISSWAETPGGTPDIPTAVELPDGSVLQVYHCSMTAGPERTVTFLDLNGILLER